MINPVDFIHEETNLAKQMTSALGYAQPMVLPFRNIVVVSKGSNDKYVYENVDTIRKPDEGEMEKGLSNLGDNFFQCEMSFMTGEKNEEVWKLPVDPLVSVNGKNVIKRRYVAKSNAKENRRGSIKECWSQDDYEITIAGVLIAEDNASLVELMKKLREICDKDEAVKVVCKYVNDSFGINYIAIESYDFPFTKGMENQSFTIKAYSDDSYELLEKI